MVDEGETCHTLRRVRTFFAIVSFLSSVQKTGFFSKDRDVLFVVLQYLECYNTYPATIIAGGHKSG